MQEIKGKRYYKKVLKKEKPLYNLGVVNINELTDQNTNNNASKRETRSAKIKDQKVF